jgi:diguanylate cyclase (GGDEF)-like protein
MQNPSSKLGMATILVADDEPINRTLIQRRLEREKFSVITAIDGAQAVEVTKASMPDLVLMDIMMPVMDGLEACKIIKADARTRDIPVIFLSARDELELKVSGLASGANDYISKPFSSEELLARVNVALRLKQERDQLKSATEKALATAQSARERSMKDALTGLFNRYGLQHQLAREIAEARRYGRELCCLMIDIDKFKTVNDTYGHLVGDRVIQQTADVLIQALRKSDALFRYGGEEFLVLLPETGLEGAATLAEKVRWLAERASFGDDQNPFNITLSVGVAELRFGESGHDMIARADLALYQAKEHGRNRVEVAEEG